MIFFLIIGLAVLVVLLLYWLFLSSYSQIFGYFPYRIKTSDKEIALSFDDGPNEPYTSMLLDFLASKKIRVTFFLVGKNIKKYPKCIKRMLNDGHTLANHSYSHEFKNYFKSLTFNDEVMKNQETIKEFTGVTPKLYRPPWLFRTPFILNNLKKNNLIPISGIFCHPLEVVRLKPSKIAKNAIKNTKSGGIIIFHDGIEGKGGDRKNSIEASKLFVNTMLKKGYKFVTIDQLLKIDPYNN